MQFPWVSRSKLNAYRRRYHEAAAMTTTMTAMNDVLTHQLDLSQRNAADLQLKLLRVGFGINPFHELYVAAQGGNSVLPDPSPSEPDPNQPRPGASAEEVQATFVREAMELYPGNMRRIKQHVEKRQGQYYAGQMIPDTVNPAEMAAARQVQADMLAAIEEGRREAEKE
jgi:hypothetical protein